MNSDLSALENSLGPTSFDYESKLWGDSEVSPTPGYLGGLRLRYCLDDLKGIHGKVLEVGCGGGGMSRAIQRHRPDLEVYGVDISRPALHAAINARGGVHYALGDAHQLPIKSSTYDAVVVLDVLEHLPNVRIALREVHRILKPSGLLHIYCPLEGDPRNLHGLLHRLGWRAKERLIGHIQHFTEAELVSQLESVGFLPGKHRWSGHLLYQLADSLYFSFLSLARQKKRRSIEGAIQGTRSEPKRMMLLTAKTFVSVLLYLESIWAPRIPGAGIHALANVRVGDRMSVR